jgi:hypothetical protein
VNLQRREKDKQQSVGFSFLMWHDRSADLAFELPRSKPFVGGLGRTDKPVYFDIQARHPISK